MEDILGKAPQTDEELKSCCANLYEHEAVRFFLGESYHPGGLELTFKLAERLELKPGDKVLDIASGLGTSAIALARQFKVRITGLDFSEKNCRTASEKAEKEGVQHLTKFVRGDAEDLPFQGDYFIAVISECSFCTFPDKQTAANEMFRVVKPGGKLGLTDVILNEKLPEKWQNYVSHIFCLADAKSFDGYNNYLEQAGFKDIQNYDVSQVFIHLAKEIKVKLMLAQLAVGLGKLKIPGFDVNKGNQYINEAVTLIQAKKAGYGMIVARI